MNYLLIQRTKNHQSKYRMKRRKVNEKSLKMTYPIYLTIAKFGKDISSIILDFLFQCERCGDLEIGPIYNCEICSPNMNLCQNCYDMTGFTCIPWEKCMNCWFCNMGFHHVYYYQEVVCDGADACPARALTRHSLAERDPPAPLYPYQTTLCLSKGFFNSLCQKKFVY